MAEKVTRREFVRDSAAVAAGMAVGLTATYTVAAGNPAKADTSKILNYNPDMEYRRCGKTDWMVSAVCLGGHWKRVNKVVPGLFEGGSWLGADARQRRVREEPLRRGHPVHRAGHQLHRRLHRARR